MRTTISYTPTSLRNTQLAFRRAQAKLAAAASKAEAAGAAEVAREMAARAPVQTGKLKASIRAQGSSAVATAPYAVFVDKGTGDTRAQPFAEEGVKAATSKVEEAMAAVFRTALGGS